MGAIHLDILLKPNVSMALDPDLPDLEQEFRQTWRRYDPSRYPAFLNRTDEESRVELLARMISAELEFRYQPPSSVVRDQAAIEDEDDDDERVVPCLRLFTLRFPELLDRQDLLMQLIVLEYALRLRHESVPPNPDSYLELCPNASSRLESLLELTESKLHSLFDSAASEVVVSKSESTVSEKETAQPLTVGPLPFNLGCFLLTRMIGRGGMGYVHAAIDLRSAALVAVKVMRRVDSWSVYRFIDEFSWLSQLYHPHLVRLYDAFSDGDMRYFSMELVEGKTIRDWFRRMPGTDEQRWRSLRKVLAQLASAIDFLHSQGVVHRDIKCSNVMITPRRRAVLLDLGLAMRQSEISKVPVIDVDGERVIGTLQYLAPEGLCGEPLTAASDWYSFGVLLYEVMLNNYPQIHVNADAASPGEKYSIDFADIRNKLADCPKELADLCVKLLAPLPSQRPGAATVLSVLGTPAKLNNDTSLELLGRAVELQQLNDTLASLQAGESSVVQVLGECGLGKSALLETWQRSIDPQRVFLISLRCYRQDHTPLRMLNLIVQQVVRLLVESYENYWVEPVQKYAKSIGRTFPQINQLLPGKSTTELTQSLDPDTAAARRDASLRGLHDLLTELSAVRPLAIVVDDAQWADADSLNSVIHWLHVEEPRVRGLLVIASDHGEKDRLPPATPDRARAQQIYLKPLSDEVCVQLLRKMSEQSGIRLSPAIQSDFLVRAGGNPFLLLELFRAFQQAARETIFSEERWLNSNPDVATYRRFSLLPIQAENVLQYLAVAEQPLGFHQLQMVSRIAPNELQSTLSYLDAQGWIRIYRDQLDSEVEIANSKYNSLILSSIPPERMQRRHFRTARVLSSEVPPPWQRIGHHYWLASKKREAAACYMEAARVAAKASAFDKALRFLDRALIDEAKRSSLEHRSALRLKADCLAGMGTAAKAAEQYMELSQDVSDMEEATLLECLAGEQRIRGGELDDGLMQLRSALTQLNITPSRISWIKRLKFRVRALLPDRQSISPPTPGGLTSRPFTLLEQCLTRVSAPLTFLDNRLGTELILKLDETAADHGTIFDHTQVLLRTGLILAFGGRRWRKRAMRRLRLGRSLARSGRVGVLTATADLCTYIWYMQRGKHYRAEFYARRAAHAFRNTQPVAQWEIQFLNFGILGCLWLRGELKELQSLTKEFRSSAESRSDAMSQFWMNVNASIWSDLSENEVAKAEAALSVASQVVSHHSFQSPRFLLWQSRILVFLYTGDWQRAKALLEQDWDNLFKSYVLRTNHYLWLALSVRICVNLQVIRHHSANRSHAMVRSSLKDARQCIRHMRGLGDRPFVTFAMAFELVLEASVDHVLPMSVWETTIKSLRTNRHQLMAHALQWHQSLVAAKGDARELKQGAEQALLEAGCAAPAKLLDILLPLPFMPS